MRIAFIGTGDIGGALARACVRAGHQVTVTGSRPGSASAARVVRESAGRAREAMAADAVRDADLVVLAVPWAAVDETMEAVRDALAGKVLVVVTVPYVEGSDDLAVGTHTSGAEIVAAKAPGARVVQAFNTVAGGTVDSPDAHGEPVAVIVSGDDAEAKRTVSALAEELGFDPVDGGPLRTARFTEPTGMLWAALAFEGGNGEETAFRVLRRRPRG